MLEFGYKHTWKQVPVLKLQGWSSIDNKTQEKQEGFEQSLWQTSSNTQDKYQASVSVKYQSRTFLK